jgi:hypothetical protein
MARHVPSGIGKTNHVELGNFKEKRGSPVFWRFKLSEKVKNIDFLFFLSNCHAMDEASSAVHDCPFFETCKQMLLIQ